MGDDTLTLLLALQVQAIGTEALAAISEGLAGIAESGGLAALAIAPIAAGLVAIGAAAAVIGESVTAYDSFNSRLVTIQNNTGLAQSNMQAFGQDVLSIASATGASIDSVAGAFEHAMNVTQDFTASQAIATVATESAVSTGADATQVTNLLAGVMHEYGLDVSTASTAQERFNQIQNSANQIMGAMHIATQDANTQLGPFTDATARATGIAANLGISYNDVFAATAALTKHGFPDVFQAGTQVTDMLTHMMNPTKQARDELDALAKKSGDEGVAHAFDVQNLSARGLQGTLSYLRQTMLDLGYTGPQIEQVMNKLINAQRGGTGAAALLGTAYEDDNKILAQLNDTTQTATVTHDAFMRTLGTAAGQWNLLKVGIQAAQIELGQNFGPVVTGILTWLNGVGLPTLEALASAFAQWLQPAVAAVAQEFQRLGAAVQAGGLLGALQLLWQQITAFAGSLFQAGWNLVSTFASGMAQAAASVLVSVVDEITSFIAGFFVGQSPPPQGPLSKIDQGGANTMQAFIDGMVKQLNAGGLTAVAQQVADGFKGMANTANFAPLAAQVQATTAQMAALQGQTAGTATAAKAAAANIKEAQSALQSESAQVTTALDGINAQLQTNTDQQKIVQTVVTDITDQYKQQIDPLQQQLDALRQQVDYTQQLRDANEAVQMAQLDQKILNDQGDPVKKAQLESQLQGLQARQRELDIQAQIANLEAQKKQAAGNPDKLTALNIQLQELGIQQQIADLANKPQLAADQLAKAQLAATMAQQAADAKVAEVKKKAEEAALEQQIAAKKALEAAALKPYQDQLQALKDQAQVLNAQKQQWTDLKGEIAASTQQAQSLTSALGAATSGIAALKAAHAGGIGGFGAKVPTLPTLPTAGAPGSDPVTEAAQQAKKVLNAQMQSFDTDLAKKAQDSAKKWVASFGAQLQTDAVKLPAAIGDLGVKLTDWLGGEWAKINWTAVWGRATGIAAGLGTALAAVDWGKAGTDLGTGLGKALGFAIDALKVGGALAGKLLSALGDLFGQIDWGKVGAAILPRAVDFFFGLFNSLFDPSVWGEILGKHWLDILMLGLSIAFAPAKLLGPIAEILGRAPLVGPIAEWLLRAINEAGGPVREKVATFVGDAFSVFGKAMHDAIFPPAEALMGEFGRTLQGMLDTIGLKFLYWVEDAGKTIAGAGPRQIVEAVRGVMGQVDAYLTAFVSEATQQGGLIVRGLWQGIVDLASWFELNVVDWVNRWLLIPIKVFFGIASPSAVMAGVGRDIVMGLIQGIGDMAQAALAAMTKLVQDVLPALQALLPQFVAFGGSIIDNLKAGILAKAGDIANAAKQVVQGAVSAAQAALSGVQAAVSAIGSTVGHVLSSDPNAPGAAKSPQAWAGGVPLYATGTDFHPGGAAIIGENGPELVNLPRGSQVIPLLPGAPFSGTGGGVVVNITGNYLLSQRDLEDLASKVGRVLARQTSMAVSLIR